MEYWCLLWSGLFRGFLSLSKEPSAYTDFFVTRPLASLFALLTGKR